MAFVLFSFYRFHNSARNWAPSLFQWQNHETVWSNLTMVPPKRIEIGGTETHFTKPRLEISWFCFAFQVMASFAWRWPLGPVHTGCGSTFARKFACKPFDVACELCEHSY